MTQATTIKEVKQQLTQSMEMVKRPEYLDAEIRPYLEFENGANGNWETRVLQLDAMGAATLEITLNGERVFGKFFADDSSPFVYQKLNVFRAAGFGPGERYQVVEPLSFTPDQRSERFLGLGIYRG